MVSIAQKQNTASFCCFSGWMRPEKKDKLSGLSEDQKVLSKSGQLKMVTLPAGWNHAALGVWLGVQKLGEVGTCVAETAAASPVRRRSLSQPAGASGPGWRGRWDSTEVPCSRTASESAQAGSVSASLRLGSQCTRL